MSEVKRTLTCPVCGSECAENATLCIACGSKFKQKKGRTGKGASGSAALSAAAEALTEAWRYATAEAEAEETSPIEAVPTEEAEVEAEAEVEESTIPLYHPIREARVTEKGTLVIADIPDAAKLHYLPLRDILGRFVLLLIALSLLFSAFMPIAYTEVVLEDRIETRVEYSLADSITMAVCSFVWVSQSTMEKTEQYQEYKEEYTRLTRSFRPTTASATRIREVQDLAKETMMLSTLRRTSISATTIITALFSLLYILFALSLLIRALISFFASLKPHLGLRHRISNSYDKEMAALFRLLLFFLPLFYLFPRFCRPGGGEWASFVVGYNTHRIAVTNEIGGTGRLIPLFLLAGITLAVAVGLRVRTFRRDTGWHPKETDKRNILILVLTVLLVVSSFLPALSLRMADVDGRTVRVEREFIGITDIAELKNHNDIGTYAPYNPREFSALSGNANYETLLTEIPDAVGSRTREDGFSERVLRRLIVGIERIDPGAFYIALLAVHSLFLLTAVILITRLIAELLLHRHGRRLDRRIRRGKLLLGLLALAEVILFAILRVLAAGALTGTLSHLLSVRVSIFGVLTVLLSFALVRIRCRSKKVYLDNAYDNPDTSYAPYVME